MGTDIEQNILYITDAQQIVLSNSTFECIPCVVETLKRSSKKGRKNQPFILTGKFSVCKYLQAEKQTKNKVVNGFEEFERYP